MVSFQPDGAVNFRLCIAFIVLDTLAIALRLASKSQSGKLGTNDDYWIVLALLWFGAWNGIIMYTILNFQGTLNLDSFTDLNQVQDALRILWIGDLMFPMTITPIKISLLSYYRLVFITPQFKRATYVVTALCIAWLIAGFFVIIFQCTPYQAVYDLTLQMTTAYCFPFDNFVFTYELINSLLDVCILALPAYMIRKLQMPLRRKIEIASIFLLGAFVLVTCVLRMVYSYDPQAPQKVPSAPNAVTWSTVELGTAMLCACLPTYRKLVPKSFRPWTSSKGYFSKQRSGTIKRPFLGDGSSRSNWYRMKASESVDREHLTDPQESEQRAHDVSRETAGHIPLENIFVEHRVDVAYE